MIELSLRIDRKGWRFFAMKRTQTRQAVAGSLQLHNLAHHLHNIGGLFDGTFYLITGKRNTHHHLLQQ
jgi:hypothetical protein